MIEFRPFARKKGSQCIIYHPPLSPGKTLMRPLLFLLAFWKSSTVWRMEFFPGMFSTFEHDSYEGEKTVLSLPYNSKIQSQNMRSKIILTRKWWLTSGCQLLKKHISTKGLEKSLQIFHAFFFPYLWHVDISWSQTPPCKERPYKYQIFPNVCLKPLANSIESGRKF